MFFAPEKVYFWCWLIVLVIQADDKSSVRARISSGDTRLQVSVVIARAGTRHCGGSFDVFVCW